MKGLPESSDNNSEIFSDWRVLDIFDEFRRISGFIAAYFKLVHGLILARYQSYAGEGPKFADIRVFLVRPTIYVQYPAAR